MLNPQANRTDFPEKTNGKQRADENGESVAQEQHGGATRRRREVATGMASIP
jgi:hypothetical protein